MNGIDASTLIGWLIAAGTTGGLLGTVSWLLPPVRVIARVDPTWQVQASVRLQRPWKRHLRSLDICLGLPPSTGRLRRDKATQDIIIPTASDFDGSDGGVVLEGFFDSQTFVIDLPPQPPHTELTAVAACGRRTSRTRVKPVPDPFFYS